MTSSKGFSKSLSPQELLREAHILQTKLVDLIAQELNSRGAKNRSGDDDSLFIQFNTFLAIIVGQGHVSFGIEIFHDIENQVRQFESQNNTEVHKGSIFFNVGLLYLWSGDFDNALYYWVKAEDEDKKTYGHVKYNIFTIDLFQKNFGRIIKQFIEQELSIENNTYKSLTGTDFKYKVFERHLSAIESHHLPNFLTNVYKRIRYSRLEPNEATSILYYHLVSDCCSMFETLLKKHLRDKSWLTQNTLGSIIRNNLHQATTGDMSNIISSDVGNRFRCNSVADYNNVLPSLLTELYSETNSARAASLLLHLMTITRNQALHDIEKTNIIYGDIEMCKKLIRLSFMAELFEEYI